MELRVGWTTTLQSENGYGRDLYVAKLQDAGHSWQMAK